MVARRVGEKDIEQASRSAGQAILLTLIISVIISIIGLLFSHQILRAMGASEDVITYGSTFTQIAFVGNIVVMLIHLLNGIFRGAGNAAIAMKSLWLGNICNIILCPICIHFWGITGAAIATTTGRGIGVIYQLWNLCSGKGMLTIKSLYFKPDFSILSSLSKLSLTATLQFIVASASWIGMIKIISNFGSDAVAGYTIAFRLIVFFILPAFGLSNAAATLVGQNIGAKEFDRAEESVWKVAKYNAIFMAIVSTIFLLKAEFFIGLINNEPAVLKIGTLALRIISLGYIFYGIGMVMMNAFNGAGDSKTPTMINIFWFWIFQIPIAWLMAIKLNWGVTGVFTAIVVTETLVTITSIIIFKKGWWKQVKI
jgi:putative MATE family efflux protein